MKNISNTKQVIIVRNDIKISAEKLAGQVAHAAVMLYHNQSLKQDSLNKALLNSWLNNHYTKIILQADLKEILKIQEIAKNKNINNFLVIDSGFTELEPNTITCLGIGVHYNDVLNPIIKHLKLYK